MDDDKTSSLSIMNWDIGSSRYLPSFPAYPRIPMKSRFQNQLKQIRGRKVDRRTTGTIIVLSACVEASIGSISFGKSSVLRPDICPWAASSSDIDMVLTGAPILPGTRGSTKFMAGRSRVCLEKPGLGSSHVLRLRYRRLTSVTERLKV